MCASIHSDSDYLLLSSESRSLIIKQTTTDWSMSFENKPGTLIFSSENQISIGEECVADIQVIDNNGDEIFSDCFPMYGSRSQWKLRIDSFLNQFLEEENELTSYAVCSKLSTNHINGEWVKKAIEMKIHLYSRPLSKLESLNSSIHSGSLQIDSTIIDISKEYLSLHSEYFNSLFYGEFREKNDEIIKIKEIEPDDFISFIQLLHQINLSYPDVPTALNQLDLSDRFIVPIIRNSALSYLLKKKISKTDIPHGLLIADRVKSEELLVHILSFVTDISELFEISAQIVPFIDKNTVQKLFNRSSTLVNNLKEDSFERTSRLESKLKEEEARVKEDTSKLVVAQQQNAIITQQLQAWRTSAQNHFREFVIEFYTNKSITTPYKVESAVVHNNEDRNLWNFIPSKYSTIYTEEYSSSLLNILWELNAKGLYEYYKESMIRDSSRWTGDPNRQPIICLLNHLHKSHLLNVDNFANITRNVCPATVYIIIRDCPFVKKYFDELIKSGQYTQSVLRKIERPSQFEEKRPDREFKIFVIILTGERVSCYCQRLDTVEYLKMLLEQRTGILCDQQRLIYAGKQLQDGRTMSDYDIQKGSTLHLVLRLTGC